MAEYTDDFGSDADDYEDALEELQAEEAKLAARVESVTVAEQKEGELDHSDTDNAARNKDTNKQSNINPSTFRKPDSGCSETPPNSTEGQNDNPICSDKDENSESATDSEEEEGDTPKAYCDIPAEDEEKDHDALHDRLNEQMDNDEDEAEGEEEKVEDIYLVDEEAMKKLEEDMSDEEKETKKDESQVIKAEGNEQFKSGEFVAAMDTYTRALRICPLCYAKERAIMYSNRAACRFRRELYDSSAADCTKALELHPHYLKALLRRAQSYEQVDKLEQAQEDYVRVLELDPSNGQAREACMRLPDQIKEKNEKLKEEMMGKLKDLGNMVLRPFGLSTNNFNLVQNPDSGGYSINFNNNGS